MTRALSRRIASEGNKLLNYLPASHSGRLELEREKREANIRITQLKPRSHITKWNRPVTLPAELPPEIQRLQECKTYGIPVSIVISRDSDLLPFYLDEKYGIVYLGFFKIHQCQVAVYDSSFATMTDFRP